MNIPTRITLTVGVLLMISSGSSAQETTSTAGRAASAEVPATTATTAKAPALAGETTPAEEEPGAPNSHEVRNQFNALLREMPPEIATILAIDPTLLSNEPFLSGYPDLAKFVAGNPEVRRNPRFYLQGFKLPGDNSGAVEQIFDDLSEAAVFVFMTLAFAWLVRTIIEQRRWSRLSRIQTEAHNKILDRFGTSQELLEYIKSPAGTRFLESAPISVYPDQPVHNAPMGRIMWSIQLGVVIAAGGLGMLAVSGRMVPEVAQTLFALGAIALSVGAGFIASGFISIAMSRRLGLWQSPPSAGFSGDPAEG